MLEDHYASTRLLHEYLLFHFGEGEEVLPWENGPRAALHFPVRCVTDSGLLPKLRPTDRVLDVGCAVGGASFYLSAHVAEVIGTDLSASFIGAAEELRTAGQVPYEITETGLLTRLAVARRPAESVPGRLSFEVGNAQALRPDLGVFDAVIAGNLLCRLPDPRQFLGQLSGLVKPGGHLLLTTPHTWLESFTAKEFWLGATPESGEPLEALADALEGAFTLEKRTDLPFLIREHRRKYQWSVAEATLWLRN